MNETNEPTHCSAGDQCERPAEFAAVRVAHLRACRYHREQTDASIRPMFLAWRRIAPPPMNLHAVRGEVASDGGGDAVCGAVGSYLANRPEDVNCAKCAALSQLHANDVAELSLHSIAPAAGGKK